MRGAMPRFMNRMRAVVFTLLCALIFAAAHLNAQTDPAIQARVDSISRQIEQIRGLEFKRPVRVAKQSTEAFEAYIEEMIALKIPQTRLQNYGKIVRKLGLYRGPEIQDFTALAKLVIRSQAGAYYDPREETFYVVMENIPEQVLNTVYAHELYHGLQDQHYNLDRYLPPPNSGRLNDDQLLAREAVVEGEATYVMTLWTFQHTLGGIPQRNFLEMTVKAQAQMDVDVLIDLFKKSLPRAGQSDDVQQAVKRLEEIPRFMIETLFGAYLKGMAFVFTIQEKGWQKVAELYARPPASSEQILHPEKWLQEENPFQFQWPTFSGPALDHREAIDTNTIGELQWRIIFAEHGLDTLAHAAAAGWNGDAYAILQDNNDPDDLLLLIASSWDTPEDTREFASHYRTLLETKYQDNPEVTAVWTKEQDVFILEGGTEEEHLALRDFLETIEKRR